MSGQDLQWKRDMEQDALKMGAYDFAMKHKAYNLPVWERMQEHPSNQALISDLIKIVGQVRKFLNDYLSAMPPETLTNVRGQWISMTIKKIDDILERYTANNENIQRTDAA